VCVCDVKTAHDAAAWCGIYRRSWRMVDSGRRVLIAGKAWCEVGCACGEMDVEMWSRFQRKDLSR
jgi:hypothetical protein